MINPFEKVIFSVDLNWEARRLNEKHLHAISDKCEEVIKSYGFTVQSKAVGIGGIVGDDNEYDPEAPHPTALFSKPEKGGPDSWEFHGIVHTSDEVQEYGDSCRSEFREVLVLELE